jgi:hypothetical protein
MKIAIFRFINICILLIITICPNSFAKNNMPNDFIGIKWNTHLALFEGMKKIQAFVGIDTEGTELLYSRESDKAEFNGIPIRRILYVFDDNRLVKGFIALKGQEMYDKLKEYLVTSYGEPESNENNSLTWLSTPISIFRISPI